LYQSPDYYNNNNNSSLKKQSTLNLQNKDGLINGSFLSANENKSNPFYNNHNININNKDNPNYNNYNTNNQISRTPLVSYTNNNKSPSQTNFYPNKNNQNLNLTQIDEQKGNYNLENQEKLNDLNDIYLKKVKSSKNLPNYQNNISQLNQTAMNNLNMNFNNMSTLREGRSVYLNFGRLCDERDDRSKSRSPKLFNNNNQNNITNISQNKGVIKNIETNVRKKFIKKKIKF